MVVGVWAIVAIVVGCGVAPPVAAPAPTATLAPPRPTTLTVATVADPEALDPILVASTNSSLVARLIFDPLVDTNPVTGATEARLASSWRLEEPNSWLFTVRADARFHNGDPVTVDDVVFSYNRAVNDPRSRLATSKAIIQRAVALDDRTVRIVTKQPYPTFLDQLGRMGITPRAAVETLGGEAFNQAPVGAGPFRLVEWRRDDRLVLQRFADYWRSPPKLDQVTFRPIPSVSTRLAELETGRVDLAIQLPGVEVERLRQAGFVRQSVSTRRTMVVGFNAGSGSAGEIAEGPMRDPRVRAAIAHAIEAPALVNELLEGGGELVAGTLSPQNFGFDLTLERRPFDPARARALLAEAGYPDGFDIDFDVPSGRYFRDREVGEAIAGQLARVGVRARLLIQEWGAFSAKYSGQKFRGLWLLGMGKEYQADAHLLTYYASRGRGWYFRDAEVDRLIDRVTTTFDPTLRQIAYGELERRLQTTLPAVFLYTQIEHYAHKAGLDWRATADDYLWLDDASWQ